jgi:uncharacterized protein (TIRG00374 family)
MKKAALIKFAIGVGIIIYLVYFVGIGELYKTLLGMRLIYLPVIMLGFIFSVAMRSINFKILLGPHEKEGKSFAMSKLAKISIISWAAGMFTPGKLGEFSSIYLLKKEGLETGKSAAISILNKAITAFTIMIVAILGLVRFLGITEALKLSILFVALVLLPYVAFTNNTARNLMNSVFGRFLKRYEEHFAGFADEIDSYLARRKKLLLYSFLANILWIAVSSFIFLLAFAAVGQEVDFFDVMLINAIGTTTSFIPLTIGGTGLREASALIFFGQIGIGSAAILGSHIIIASVSYTLAGLTAVLFLLRKKR